MEINKYILSRAAGGGGKRKTLLPPMRIKKNSRNCKYKMGPKINTFSFFNIKSNGKHIKIHFCKYQISTNIKNTEINIYAQDRRSIRTGIHSLSKVSI